MTRTKTHGGVREGSGAHPKDPKAGNRVPVTMRLHPATVGKLKRHATPAKSQGEIVDEAVGRWQPGA